MEKRKSVILRELVNIQEQKTIVFENLEKIIERVRNG